MHRERRPAAQAVKIMQSRSCKGVTIRFTLSRAGQKDSLKRGGSGKRRQSATLALSPREIDLFEVDDDGRLFHSWRSGVRLDP